MLPQHSRLRHSAEITTVIRRGRLLRTPWVRLYWRKSGGSRSRFASIVGGRVDASSVRRHRYQRWLRVIAQEYIASLREPRDVVWVASPAISRCSSLAQLRQHLAPYL